MSALGPCAGFDGEDSNAREGLSALDDSHALNTSDECLDSVDRQYTDEHSSSPQQLSGKAGSIELGARPKKEVAFLKTKAEHGDNVNLDREHRSLDDNAFRPHIKDEDESLKSSFLSRLKEYSGLGTPSRSFLTTGGEGNNAFERFFDSFLSKQEHESDSKHSRRATVAGEGENAHDESRGWKAAPAFRRLTTFGGHGDEKDKSPDSKSALQRWKALRASIWAMGPKKEKRVKDEPNNSTALLAELMAGAPAAVIFASTFQRDEKNRRRTPVLLEQLKVSISRSTHGSRSTAGFTAELEYGDGLTKMKWQIQREYRDFFNLHSRYRLAELQHPLGRGALKLPKFPKASIPYLRGVRGLQSDSDSEEANASYHFLSTPRAKKRRGSTGQSDGEHLARREGFAEQQRQKLEKYLRGLITLLVFRPEANRLCKFLELSALGLKLSMEGSYHGKEGYLTVASGRTRRGRTFNLREIKERRSAKWFLVRSSYLVCVESPENIEIYDVFILDSSFTAKIKHVGKYDSNDPSVTDVTHHTLRIRNRERKLKLWAKNERILKQFFDSISIVAEQSLWTKRNRFDSFCPVRTNVIAEWLVDGRDYFWNLSRAISMAKDVVYIHDWWLSPQMHLRRPASTAPEWRLDRLLQRKAQEGVKIFVIVYHNVGSTVPIDSAYTKYYLLDLHPNIFVQRSPRHLRQATVFWAHHEKLCIVDHAIAFIGGLDLCYGRWDSPQHILVDEPILTDTESPNAKKIDTQIWAGKDYSNPRVLDFHSLDKPYEDLYDRSKIPRMAWHDISLQLLGQPARDATRHFIQRWNYLLRQKKPSRPTPFLLPPPDFTHKELLSFDLEGSCEVQLLRSSGSWSMGLEETEFSIQTAYCATIAKSKHFIYIENQFFITSCEWEGTVIENRIGNAIFDRIVRAFENDEDWRAIIIIPLMPGFQNAVDEQDGSSVRLIMHWQYRSISRGESSLFCRLRRHGISPEDYISFYGLRNWAEIGPKKQLVTEMVYIHAKCMIVDDRTVIIGSANINERSQRGNRDSEIACIVRDTEMIKSKMAGKEFFVGKCAHKLRIRLMREHLGIDVDALDLLSNGRSKQNGIPVNLSKMGKDKHREYPRSHYLPDAIEVSEASGHNHSDRDSSTNEVSEPGDDESSEHTNYADGKFAHRPKSEINTQSKPSESEYVAQFSGLGISQESVNSQIAGAMHTSDNGLEATSLSPQYQKDQGNIASKTTTGGKVGGERSTFRKEHRKMRSSAEYTEGGSSSVDDSKSSTGRHFRGSSFKLSDEEGASKGSPNMSNGHDRLSSALDSTVDDFERKPAPKFDAYCFADPLAPEFFLNVWHACAVHNTSIYRSVFRCMPDNEVKTWREYKEYLLYSDRIAVEQGADKGMAQYEHEAPGASGPPGTGLIDSLNPIHKLSEKAPEGLNELKPMESTTTTVLSAQTPRVEDDETTVQAGEALHSLKRTGTHNTATTDTLHSGPPRRRKRAGTRVSGNDPQMDRPFDRERAIHLLHELRGHLVQWPSEWLAKEAESGNWLYSYDRIAPIEIYN